MEKKEILYIYIFRWNNKLSRIIEKIQIYGSVWKPEIKISINVNPTTKRDTSEDTYLQNIHDQMEFDTLFERIDKRNICKGTIFSSVMQ